MPRAIAFVSNEMSAAMLRAALGHDGLPPSEVCLISGRRLTQGWVNDCREFVHFSRRASLTFFGQLKALGFYLDAVSALKRWLNDPAIEHVYIVNSDNLINNHILRWAEQRSNVKVSVLVEGNMNFHEVTKRNRAWWRWPMKPPMAKLLRLSYREPQGHLSGSFEPRVDRVISYAALHLKAPSEKVLVLPLSPVKVTRAADPDTVLVIVTGISQWMSISDFRIFKAAFAAWVGSLGARRILVKLHPNYPSGDIERELREFEYFEDPRPLEAIAGDIPAGTVVGYWTTGLVSLKILRPDLRCIDFGNDFYARAAYHGDVSLHHILQAAGVEVVLAEPYIGMTSGTNKQPSTD